MRAVLFDWDGTLVNSAEATFRCYQRMFSSQGIAFDAETFQRSYSPDWHQTYRAVGLPEDKWAAMDEVFTEEYVRENSQLLPGALDVLRRLGSLGVAQGVVTSGNRKRVLQELDRFEISPFFATVICHEDTPNKKPHPEPLLVALEELVVPHSAAVYVGDSPEDVEMARAAGVYSVGIPGGFPNHDALSAAEPDMLAPSLEKALAKLLDDAA